MAAISSATHLLLRLSLSLTTTTTSFSLLRRPNLFSLPSSPSSSFSLLPTCPLRALSISATQPSSELKIEEKDIEFVKIEENNDTEFDELEEKQEFGDNNDNNNESGGVIRVLERERKVVPNLTPSEKKDLRSYANGLGDKLKSQQVGKSGVTDNVVLAMDETLEANEFLKLKVHKTCPGELEDVVRQLEQATGSVVVGQISRTMIFYRPSITKQKAEEKRELNRKLMAQKRQKVKTSSMMWKREQLPRQPGQGYYGNRRFPKAPS